MSSIHKPINKLMIPSIVAFINLLLLLLTLAKLILYSNDEHYSLPWSRWTSSVGIPALFAFHGYRKRSINLSGVISGSLIGVSMVLSSYCVTVALFVCFLATSFFTRFREDIKRKFEANFKEGGQRNWIQVVSNLGVANVMILLRLYLFGGGEFTVDFNTSENYWNSWLLVGALSAISCALGDTLSSELGPVLSEETEPLLITTFRSVPKGTNGGVTIVGLLSACFGGLLIGICSYFCLTVFPPKPHQWTPMVTVEAPQWPIVLFCIYSGVFGSVLDSILGATLQYTGYDHRRRRVVETPPDPSDYVPSQVEHISGRNILDNHAVNMLSILVTGIVMASVAGRFWPPIHNDHIAQFN